MYDIYTVLEGDTIESIANKFGTTQQKMYELNSFLEPTEYLKAGQKIIVPVARPAIFDYYTIQKGDTLYNIAKEFNSNPKSIAKINGIELTDYIYPNQTLIVPKQGVDVVITRPGDTFDSIAKDLNATVLDLLFQNQNIYLQPEQLVSYKKTSNKN